MTDQDDFKQDRDTWEVVEKKIDDVWASGTDWTRDKWNDTVETITDSFEDTKQRSDVEIAKAKSYFKGRYDQYKKDKE